MSDDIREACYSILKLRDGLSRRNVPQVLLGYLDRIFELCEVLAKSPVDTKSLSTSELGGILKSLGDVETIVYKFRAIGSHDLHDLEVDTQREYLADGLTVLRQVVESFGIPYSSPDRYSFSIQQLAELDQRIAETQKQTAEAQHTLSALSAMLTEKAKTAGVVAHADSFDKQADRHKRSSARWLTIVAAVVVILGLVSWWALHDAQVRRQSRQTALETAFQSARESKSPLDPTVMVQINETYGLDVQFLTVKLAVLSLLFTILVFATKNYRAHKHNQISNEHRRNCLQSFEAFVAGAGDDREAKAAILIQATTSIYSGHVTGYSSPDTEGDGATKIVEIVRDLTGRGDKR